VVLDERADSAGAVALLSFGSVGTEQPHEELIKGFVGPQWLLPRLCKMSGHLFCRFPVCREDAATSAR
jgi:hypothetical protein